MRGFLFCIVLLGLAGFGAYYMGWISLETGEDGKTQITIDGQKAKDDTKDALDKTKDTIRNVASDEESDGTQAGDDHSAAADDNQNGG